MRGYTLVELMIVIAIVGVFIGMAVPTYKNYMVKTRVASAFPIMQNYAQLGQEYYEMHGSFGDAQALGLPIDTDSYNIQNPSSINEYTSTQIIDTDATDLCYNNIRFTFNSSALGISQSFDIQMVVRNVDGLFVVTCGIPWDQNATNYADVLQYFPESCVEQNVSSC